MKFVIAKLHLFLLIFICESNVSAFSYRFISNEYFTSIHVLTVDIQNYEIIPERALESNVARETVLSIAKRKGALAAINGGFWKESGKPAGILKIANRWLGTPTKPRGAIGWKDGGTSVLLDQVLTGQSLEDIDHSKLINVLPQSDPPYSLSESWEEMQNIVGGTPILVRNSNILQDYTSEQTILSFLTKRHPRTAVGILPNGDWVFVVVDGRLCGVYGGMDMWELAGFMQALGCVEALNLDGGGSSTMIIGGGIINEPCGSFLEEGKNVEKVSDAILIFPRS